MRYLIVLSLLLLTACSSGGSLEEVTCFLENGPVCGKIQVQCITTPCDPVSETFVNACEAEERGAFDVVNGECEVPVLPLPEGTFGRDEEGFEHGELFVRGYGMVEQRNEAFCEENCEVFDYVLFRITEMTNPHLSQYFKDHEGNAFVAENTIGLGCLVEGKLSYKNSSAGKFMADYEVSEALTQQILSATEESPISLRMEKPLLKAGSGAPTCYSHFIGVEEF